MKRASDTGDSKNDRKDGHAPLTAGNRRQMRKTSDDLNSNDHRGNRSGESQLADDRSIGRVNSNRDIAGGRRGNQMKSQLNHSSDPD